MLKIYNTLRGRKENFKPLQGKKVRIFVCGPTVYDFPHIGHSRTYIVFDSFVNFLRFIGYQVFYLQNITDIDDKIIDRAKKEKKKFTQIASKFEKIYLEDMKILGIDSVNVYARATDHIQEIISQVQRLLDKGYAYPLKDGIYFDISKFKNYGKLSRRTILQAEDSVSRIDQSILKRNKGDFCLWKISKPGEPFWHTPLGKGRPGWHIEDTAITERYFGCQYDIHGGARDLIFPHHEAEIAQMESISGKSPMVRYWLHTGFLTVNGQKMSKSLKNFITIREFLKNHSPFLLRFFVLTHLWRSPLDYSENKVKEAETSLRKIENFLVKIKDCKPKKKENKTYSKIFKKYKKEFFSHLHDDFNTPKAFSSIFNLIREIYPCILQDNLGKKEKDEILKFFEDVNKIFKIFGKRGDKKIPLYIKSLAEKREKLRKEKKWKEADEIRKKIEERGYKIEDTLQGFVIGS